jgi:hypothetical protein
MKAFYVTLPKSKARRILEGKLRLADEEFPRVESPESPDTVELHDELEPPLKSDKRVILRIVVPKTEDELEPCLIPIEDNPDNIYNIPGLGWMRPHAALSLTGRFSNSANKT